MNLDEIAEVVSTWFGAGESPIAPGTMGSIAAVPLHLLLRAAGPGTYLGCTLALTAVGTWAANRTALKDGEEDPQRIVIDEVAGTLIAMGLVARRSPRTQLLALVLFRVFDITKPGFIDRVQHVKPWGVGIMADDVLAGIAAGVVTRWLPRVLR